MKEFVERRNQEAPVGRLKNMQRTSPAPSRTLTRRFIALLLILGLFATACSSDDATGSGERGSGDSSGTEGDPGSSSGVAGNESQEGTGSAVTVRIGGEGVADTDTEILIDLGNYDGTDADQGVVRETTIDGTPLNSADTALLLSRLTDLEEDEADRTEFNRPPETRPRPRPGTTVEQSFPPAGDGDPVETTDPGPLEVLRFQPEGAVDLAPFISVTFNQPMIALGTVDQVEAADVPITITPEMPGRWIWLGTRTARFEYEVGAIDRIPAATNYVVEIGEATTSANGAELDEPVRFEFSTPTVQVRDVVPMHNSLPTEPIFFIEFDQRVDPQAVLEVITLTANGERVDVRLANDEEIAEDPAIQGRSERALPDRWMAIRPAEPLPTAARLSLTVGPEIPSVEGPEVSNDTFDFAGQVYGPLEIVNVRCGWGDQCTPGTPFYLEFSNPLDPEAFNADLVRIDPEIPGARIGVAGRELSIQGFTKGRTTYEITINAALTDTFGQQLGEDVTRSIDVGNAPPALFGVGRQLVTLDPIIDDGRLNVTSINNDRLLLQIYEVDPETDWVTYQENGWRLTEDRENWNPPWRVLDQRTINTNGEEDEFATVALDLVAELENTGHVVVVVGPEQRRNDDWQNRPLTTWVQRTHLGIDAITDNSNAIVWVTDLRSGEPVVGAEVTMAGSGSATTDADGLAELPLQRENRSLLVEADGDRALIGEFWANAWERDDDLRWYVVDDRGIYKPGETAQVKGWVRRSDRATPSDLSLPDGGQIRWRAQDAFGNEIGAGSAELSPGGGFDFEVEFPTDITLGPASISFDTNAFSGVSNGGWWHELMVQEFRRPDFEVSASVESAAPHFLGDELRIDATAEYFAGGALAGSTVDWLVTGSATSYSPPNWPDYDFGIWVPWWFDFGFGGESGRFGDDFGFGGPGFGGGTSEAWNAITDGEGSHALSTIVTTEGKPRPISINANATVIDVNRQPISSSTSALLHPAELYVGLRGGRTFVERGQPLDIDVIVTDLDGALQGDVDVLVTSTRLEWRFEGGEWTEVPVTDGSCEASSAGDGPVRCSFEPSEGGRYRIAATVTDTEGRSNLTELTRWVSGGDRPQSRRVQLEQLTLIPNGEQWQPGDVAEVLVQSPFVDAHGLAVISRGSIDRTITFDFDASGAAVLEIPVSEDDIPGIGVQIEVAGTAPRSGSDGRPDPDLPARPAFAAGQLTLPVPPDGRELTVDVAPRQARLEPGEATQVDVAITGPDGQPVADAEMLVIVVDEAVLSLTGYQLGDPLDAFYPRHGGFAQSWRGRATLLLADPSIDKIGEGGDIAEEASEDFDMAMADDGAADFATTQAAPEMAATARGLAFDESESAGGPAPIEVRSNFEALAVFEPQVTTNAEGRATIDVPLPDNLTRYRVMVVATADATEAGSGESNITARLPITVRPTPPRFANFGDRFEFPVVVQNATDEALDVDVAFRSTNLSVQGRDGTTVTVPANDRVEVRFEVAADDAGTARYQIAAAAGSFADAAEGSFPVYTPATAEAFATYGVVDSGSIAQPFTEPQDVFPQFGGLEVSTSSTAVSALTDAVIYLHEYRYDNSDAFASRILAIVALDEVLAAFEADQLPSPDELRSTVNGDIDRLTSMQNGDGGFPYWRRGRESIPYNSVQATHALVLAEQDGFDVGGQTLENALWYLANIEDHMPPWYGERTRRAISAYALHVRFLAGDRDVAKATRIFNDSIADDDRLQLDVAGWLWPVLEGTELDDEIELLLNNRVTETPNAATFSTNYEEQAYVLLHSDRRTDAIVLDALLRMRPNSDLVLKTLNGLLSARSNRGYWRNIQENSFVLLAGSAYFDQFEDVDPDFIARAWLGDTYAVEHAYDGRSTDVNATLVPMELLVDGSGDRDIVVAKDGNDGRLYYRLGLRYAPTDFELEPRDQGFVVARTYEAIDDPDDVVANDDGTWTVRAGARVRVRLTMVADSRRTHVALLDPMPAGFEAVNPALATSEPIPQADPADSFGSRFWWYRWFDHQNLRDDRAEAFATWLGAGSYEYTYVTRATTPGTFVVPPARAEQMYEPEVFGRSANTTVTIIDE